MDCLSITEEGWRLYKIVSLLSGAGKASSQEPSVSVRGFFLPLCFLGVDVESS